MSGTLTHLGSLTIGECLPTFFGVYAGVLANLQSKLAGLLRLQAKLAITPPSLGARIDLAVRILAALRASLTLNLPGIDFKVAAVAKLIAAIEVELAVLVGIEVALGSAGVHAYSYDGDVASLGPSFTSLGIPGARASDHCNALILATTVPGTWAAMAEVFVQ
jgi:hypothetical protein